MFTQEKIKEIASLPESAFRYKYHVEALMSLYQWVREQWTTKAIASHKNKYDLDCRSTDGKLKFALFAARELSTECLPPASETEAVREAETAATNESALMMTSKILCQAVQPHSRSETALLPPVPKTNGLEKTPAYQVMGEPIYIDELLRNYKQLVVKWHPDNNKTVEAVGRFQLITQIYQQLKGHWLTKYSPLIPIERIGQENLERAKAKKFPWSPESFWR